MRHHPGPGHPSVLQASRRPITARSPWHNLPPRHSPSHGQHHRESRALPLAAIQAPTWGEDVGRTHGGNRQPVVAAYPRMSGHHTLQHRPGSNPQQNLNNRQRSPPPPQTTSTPCSSPCLSPDRDDTHPPFGPRGCGDASYVHFITGSE